MVGGCPDGLPVEALSDAIVRVDGELLHACNARARQLLGGDDARRVDLPLLPEAWTRLAAGEAVAMATDEGVVDVRQCGGEGGTTWMLLGPPQWSEMAAAERLRTARARLLGGLAGSIVHDLGNLLLAGVGLAEVIRPSLQAAEDVAAVNELVEGARRGSVLLRSVASMLARSPRRLRVVPLAGIVADAITVIGKSATRRNVHLHSGVAGSVAVRVQPEDVLQAIVQGAVFLLENGARELTIECRDEARAVAGGRERAAGIVVLRGHGLPQAARVRAVAAGHHAPGLLRAMATPGPEISMLVQAAAGVFAVGGDVATQDLGDALEFVYAFPAVLGASLASP